MQTSHPQNRSAARWEVRTLTVYRNFATPEDRERWLTAARTAFEQNHMGWTMWDYQGGFGVVYKENGAVRDDQMVLRALGLKK
jgi:endoglucanase